VQVLTQHREHAIAALRPVMELAGDGRRAALS
jgi:hypothetical protein